MEDVTDSMAIWGIRLVLFLRFAFMAGSVVVLVLKYIPKEFEDKYSYYGYVIIAQNVALVLSAVILWISQQSNNE